MKIKLRYIYIMLCACMVMQGQTKESRADEFFKNFKFNKAIELYAEIANKNRRIDDHVLQNLADSYFNIGDYTNAEKWYSKLYVQKGNEIGENNMIKLVQCLKASHNQERADEVLLDYYKDEGRLQMILAQRQHLDSLLLTNARFQMDTLGFNSPKSDFSPAFYRDGSIVFSSTRDSITAGGKIYPWNNQPYLDLFMTVPQDLGFVPEKFAANRMSDFHDASVTVTKDMSRIYLTRNYYKKGKLQANNDGLSNMQIVMGNLYNGDIEDIQSLSINDKDYSCGHPALSSNGKKLYFTSNMPGGYGGSDIYVVSLDSDGTVVSPPKNLGPAINTKGREMFPYVVNDVLYFSSDGHYGLGGLDLFKSKIIAKDEYSLPVNMGKPFNSNMDDFSLIINEDFDSGYFASNRMGGVGDDDIYAFKKIDPTHCLVYSGQVLNKITNEPVPFANVEVKNPTDGLIEILLTDERGFYEIELPCNRDNKMVFFKERFSKQQVSVITTDKPQPPSTDNLVYLTPYDDIIEKDGAVEKIKVDPIYFDYDKSNITARAEIELKKVLFAMQQFPDIRIKIESHTDSRGSDSYNLRLSDDRAKSTRKYLIAQGIAQYRILSATGYGETMLINECSNGVKCSEQEHLVNRRSDFIVLKENIVSK
ncbi:WD40-like Beta Propeller Repeat [Maribacter sedimenticola]|uniref:WD40-like Beta Propeller Repeat n=1 Tax=Maribacter sedimenticola TaxID=228956 RepID=A0ABY1SL23_9FLAO|nr:OmpA family protein [Maribacter sedimenticola]SNR71510.1 WD40-like Beta Propeller Repeat [Maribacter sedimenticola]